MAKSKLPAYHRFCNFHRVAFVLGDTNWNKKAVWRCPVCVEEGRARVQAAFEMRRRNTGIGEQPDVFADVV